MNALTCTVDILPVSRLQVGVGHGNDTNNNEGPKKKRGSKSGVFGLRRVGASVYRPSTGTAGASARVHEWLTRVVAGGRGESGSGFKSGVEGWGWGRGYVQVNDGADLHGPEHEMLHTEAARTRAAQRA